MPLITGNGYLDLLADDPVAQRALMACAAALRLDDESASDAIEIVPEANGRKPELLHEVQKLGGVGTQWDGAWYLSEKVRKELVIELHRQVPNEVISKLRGRLADRADERAADMPADGQITDHRLRAALIEAGYQRTMSPQQNAKGGEQLGAVWEGASPTAGEATALTDDYLAPEIEKYVGQVPVQVLFLRGMAARVRGDRPNQEKYFRAVWERGSKGYLFAVAAHLFGNLERNKTRAEKAFKDSLRWHSAPSHQAQVWHSLGNLLAKDRARWQDAEAAYHKSLELDPLASGKAQVWHSLGNLLTKNRARWQDAEGAYDKSIELWPNREHEAHVGASYANLLSKYGDREADDRAEKVALSSLENDAGNPWTNGVCYRVLADIYERRGDNHGAINALQSLMETNQIGR